VSDLINTLEAPGEFDALTTLRQGEPYFLLVGRDRSAPRLIDEWADMNRRRALKEYGEGLITLEAKERELRKSTQAEMIAASMVEFKNNWVASQKAEEKPRTYSGHQLPEDTRRSDALQSARARAAAALNNAVAECFSLAEAFPEEEGMEAVAIGLVMMRELSEHIAPKRPIQPAPVPLLKAAEIEGGGESDGDEAKPE
jgi:hypothetical protein